MDTVLETPVVWETDEVILGGGVDALCCAAALSGTRRTAIVTGDTFLTGTVCAAGIYRVSEKKAEAPFLRALTDGCVCGRTGDGLLLLHPDRLKRRAEDLCDQWGTAILYAAVPLDGVETERGFLLRLAGKFGVNGVLCRHVWDLRGETGTENRYAVAVENAPFLPCARRIRLLCGEAVAYPGPGGKNSAILDLPVHGGDRERREQAVAALAALREIPGFSEIRAGRFSLRGYHAETDAFFHPEQGREEAYCRAHAYAVPHGDALPEGLYPKAENPFAGLRAYPAIPCGYPAVQNVMEADVAVAGGGTAGVLAAVHAARCGARTILLEGNAACGGTGTLGGVSAYWFGRRFAETREVDHRVAELCRMAGAPCSPGCWGDCDVFHPDCKALALASLCAEAGVALLTEHRCFAVLFAPDGHAAGLLATDGRRLTAVRCGCLIDATGDGDLAAFTGAPFSCGSDRDAVTYWASLAQYPTPGEYRNNFSATVVTADLWDYTRFIRKGRRMGGDLFDHGVYPAPRESRHIRGLSTVTLRDVVGFRNYDGCLYTCFSNCDPKGLFTADMARFGVLPPQNAAAVPLGAVIPVDGEGRPIPGLLVGGKAISCTHNAFPGLRMQPDLQHQGAALGILAARASLQGVSPADLEFAEIQREIREKTGDPLCVPRQEKITPEELAARLMEDPAEQWLDLPFEMEQAGIPPAVRSLLEQSGAYPKALELRFRREADPEKRLLLARHLLWHGNAAGKREILSALQKAFSGGNLPERRGSVQCVQMPPDHGVTAEEICLLHALAWSGGADILPPFQALLHSLREADRDYCSIRQCVWNTVECFAYAAEHTGLPGLIPLLKTLLRFPELAEERDADGPVGERLILLRLSLLRALARCGSEDGYRGLTALLSCGTLSVAVSACMELRALTGEMGTLRPEDWRNVKFSGQCRRIREKIW